MVLAERKKKCDKLRQWHAKGT